ncbi:MAG: ATP-dependent metallopeptidase FtsH/Yme1/Tma family protein, partial [Muribaculaceae bacterium]|nr:ATP-dependent metallopeptidase FtsH/Yme1/Tma family protein [Muribaculaceae bacterium]
MFPNKNSNNSGNKKSFKINLWWMYAIVFLFLFGIYYLDDNSVTRSVSYSEFENYIVKDHGIRKIIVYSDKREAEGFLTDSLARELFKDDRLGNGQGTVAKIVTDIPSADKFDSKIDQWRAEGAFTGEVKYE